MKRTGADSKPIDDAAGTPITKEQMLDLIEHCYGTDPSDRAERLEALEVAPDHG